MTWMKMRCLLLRKILLPLMISWRRLSKWGGCLWCSLLLGV
uniref:Uncharacterized protein MANES_04G124800 n=1 Tax=Rhizophora mucronata TaxID=61149 RepID=A0A2P2PMH4_RHIMU